MPIGSYCLTFNIAHEIWKKNPHRVIDLGVGLGMTGVLVRSYTQDLGRHPWKTQLFGIEGFEGYRNPVWGIYDHIHICSIQKYLKNVQPITELWDMIIMTDVIEHFDKLEGFEIAKELMNRLSPGGIVLIGTPAIFQEQGAVYGNEYERHRSAWGPYDFPAGYEILQDGSPDAVGNRMILVKYQKK